MIQELNMNSKLAISKPNTIPKIKESFYGLENNKTINNEDIKTYRINNKSIDLINNENTVDHSIKLSYPHNSSRKGHSRMSTISRRIPKFKQNDNLSNLSGEDEWNEIEKIQFNVRSVWSTTKSSTDP